MNRSTSPIIADGLTEEELLDLYLSLPPKRREERFVDTAHAAQLTGLSVRTIQFWVESGVIQAIVIGRKYRVDLNSLKKHLKNQIGKRRAQG